MFGLGIGLNYSCKHHDSIQTIKLANIRDNFWFHFSKIAKAEAKKEILNLSSKKSTRKEDVPAKIRTER